jgi:hypothetical protein
MTEFILPSVVLLKDDDVTVWGYVRAYVDDNRVVHVDFALKTRPKEKPTWLPFATMTIVADNVAYRIHGNEETADARDVIDPDRGPSGPYSASKESSVVDLAGFAANRFAEESEGDDHSVQHGTVGQDAPDPSTPGGQDDHLGDGDREDPGA